MERDWRPLGTCGSARRTEREEVDEQPPPRPRGLTGASTGSGRTAPRGAPARADRPLRRRILIREAPLPPLLRRGVEAEVEGYTFGHDIEGAGSSARRPRPSAIRAPRRGPGAGRPDRPGPVLEEGLDSDGGLAYAGRDGAVVDANRECGPRRRRSWVSSMLAAHRERGVPRGRRPGLAVHREKIVEPEHGEWFLAGVAGRDPDPFDAKVSAWKCPLPRRPRLPGDPTEVGRRRGKETAHEIRSVPRPRPTALSRSTGRSSRGPNEALPGGNGVFERYRNPVLTAGHTPVFWRYDLDRRPTPT